VEEEESRVAERSQRTVSAALRKAMCLDCPAAMPMKLDKRELFYCKSANSLRIFSLRLAIVFLLFGVAQSPHNA